MNARHRRCEVCALRPRTLPRQVARHTLFLGDLRLPMNRQLDVCHYHALLYSVEDVPQVS